MLPALVAALVFAPVRHLTYVRHSETVANATGKYNSRTLNTFSPKGEKLIQELTEKLLKEPRPDVILVSPSERALRTIAPYLRRVHRQAMVSPLLYECCTDRPKKPMAKSFGYGAKITIPADLKGLFVVGPKDDRLPAPRDYGEGLAQVREFTARFNKSFTSGRWMLVGHSAMGGVFLKGLTGKAYHVKNAEPINIDL